MSSIKDNGHIIDIKSGEIEESYFDQRMAMLGITAANINISSVNPNVPGASLADNFPLFEETEKGDIKINYFQLNGWFYNYKQSGEGWGKVFCRSRLKHPRKDDNGKDIKYVTPKGAGNFPYFPVHIIRKFQAGTEIATLVVTEGEFKAVVGCRYGLDVIGISGIHNFYSNFESKQIHPDIIQLLEVCKVKKLVFLTDADTLILKYKAESDLVKRPNLFYSAIKNFRESIMYEMEQPESKLLLKDVYYGHLLAHYAESNQKGLDDLLEKQLQKDLIVNDLNKLHYADKYFYIQNIVDGLSKIQEHFGLKDQQNFYDTYTTYLGEKEFVYRHQTFRYNSETERLEKIKHKDVNNYMRIGCDWFKVVRVPNKFNELEETVKKWSVGEISRDHVKKYPRFLEEVPKFDAWCNVPSMNGSYQRVHNDCFNLFNPLKWEPADGSIDNTLFFIRHLFSGEEAVTFGDQNFSSEMAKKNELPLEIGHPVLVALDYLTLMYQRPKQILPVFILVSKENNTGKSTFLKWLTDIFGSNATIIDNERFKQSFNAHYITKFIIGIDEGFLDVEKKAEKERLKKLATDEKQYLEFKGADVQEIDFYGKVIICSNDADNLMKIEDGEIRWFVNKVPTFQKRNFPEDPFFRDKLRSEIPAWIHFLKNRKVSHENVGRAWFDPKYIMTDQMRIIVENTRNYLDRAVDEFMNEMFLTYQQAEYTLPLDWLVKSINETVKYKLDKLQVKKYLKDKYKMELEEKPKHIQIPTGFDANGSLTSHHGTYRYYIFRKEDWVSSNIEFNQENAPSIPPDQHIHQIPIVSDAPPF